MGLNEQKGNMYPWVTHTYNVIKGKCPHDCYYCYMKVFRLPELHFDPRELKVNLGGGNFIFVGSSCDMWAELIPSYWIQRILEHCQAYDNQYLFQSKNPERFLSYSPAFPLHSFFGTTIESNLYAVGSSPPPCERYLAMKKIPEHKMVSIEPIMDLDVDIMVGWLKEIEPVFVSIGADSKGHHLPEPSPEKVSMLIEELSKFTEVKVKDNLGRLR